MGRHFDLWGEGRKTSSVHARRVVLLCSLSIDGRCELLILK